MDDLKILVVDDEIANLRKLRRTFVNKYPVLEASSGRQALELIRENEGIAVLIVDQRMPDMTGVELLSQSMAMLPDAVRIILTGYTDTDVLMQAINTCKVYRYVIKPWDPPDLLMTVERGIEAHRLALENARFRKELIRRERLARELEIAGEIQRCILPADHPRVAGYDIAVEYHPAREMGGDLYDFHWDEGAGILQVVIGDVSGKSIPAALYGAVVSGMLGALFDQSLSPGELLARANSSLIQRYPVPNYIAAACLRLQPKSGACTLANSGMPFPVLVRAGEITRLRAAGVPLGLLENTIYDELSLCMEKGDIVVLASDGVTDATDPNGGMYEEARFLESVRRHAAEGVSSLVKELYQDICQFTQNGDVYDDITIVALSRSA